MKPNYFPLTLSMVFMLLLWTSAAAQRVDFEFFTPQDGLTGGLTNNIVQGPQGFMWVLNDYKLHRFDGRKIEAFLPPAELPGSREKLWEIKLFEDSLLACWSIKHLMLLNLNTGVWQDYPTPFQAPKTYRLRFLPQAPAGELWFSVQNHLRDTLQIWRFANRCFEDLPAYETATPEKSVLTFGPEGEIFIFGERGAPGAVNQLHIWTSYSDSLSKYLIPEIGPQDVLIDVQALGNRKHLILVAHNRAPIGQVPSWEYGFYYWHPDSAQLRPHPASRFLSKPGIGFTAPLLMKNGSMWIPGYHRQLCYYDAPRDTLYAYFDEIGEVVPNDTQIFGPVPDRNGSVWFCTQIGLLRARIQESVFARYFETPTADCSGHCSFRGMTEDEAGNLYASLYQGMLQFNPQDKTSFTFYEGVQHELPLPSQLISYQHQLFLNHGNIFDPQTGGSEIIPGAEKLDFQDEGLFSVGKDGRLWWVHFNDLSVLETGPSGLEWKLVYTFPSHRIRANEAFLASPYSGLLYVGRNGRLFQYSPETKRHQWFDFPSLNQERVRVLAIEEDADQNLWLATDVGLLYFRPSSGQLSHYTTEDGLPHNFVCGMLAEGDSCLWLSTNHGLSRFSISTETFINFYEEDGLSHNEFNRKAYFKARDGHMYFGGLRGINAFEPEALMGYFRQQQSQASLSLSAFEYVDEKNNETKRSRLFGRHPHLNISYFHRSFTFEYTLTNFANPSELTYSYRMSGYENNWSPPSRFNFTRYSSLPTGSYVFEVRAKDSHGTWHPNQLSVQVRVYPPWWATGWAYLLYTLLSLGLGYAVYRFLSRRWELQIKLKEEQAEALRLKNLDSLKSKLYTNITHEFRTPLTVILGMAEQVRAQPKQYLEKGTHMIQQQGQQLLDLINQLLDLSKLEDKSLQLQLEQGDIVGFLRYLLESYQVYANSQNIILQFHSEAEHIQMDFDPEQIKQVVANLLSNALKFTPSGGQIGVKISLLQKPQRVCIRVCDSGMGIDQADLPYIFDRFYQADGTSTRERGGTGIGLAHTRELVHLMGGDIEVESELNKGSSFLIQLPIRTEAPPASSPILPLPQTLERPGQSNQKPREVTASNSADERAQLLLVEDNPDVVAYLTACLQDRFQLAVALNGELGIEQALETPPDLIISDIMMPEKDGFEVCQTLKQDERTSHVPIIMLTARADFSSKMEGLVYGADAYLEKPFNREELLLRVEKLLERQELLQAPVNQAGTETEGSTKRLEAEEVFLQKVNQVIADNYAREDFGLRELCRLLGMSRSQLYRKMKAQVNTSPSFYIRQYRLKQAQQLLRDTDLTISEIAWQVGFKDLSNFSKAFLAQTGKLPSESRESAST